MLHSCVNKVWRPNEKQWHFLTLSKVTPVKMISHTHCSDKKWNYVLCIWNISHQANCKSIYCHQYIYCVISVKNENKNAKPTDFYGHADVKTIFIPQIYREVRAQCNYQAFCCREIPLILHIQCVCVCCKTYFEGIPTRSKISGIYPLNGRFSRTTPHIFRSSWGKQLRNHTKWFFLKM